MFELPSGVVDAWINPNITPSLDGMDVTYLFPGLRERMERGTTLEQLIDEMDQADVAKGVLCSGYTAEGDREWITTARDKHPERFALSHVVDPRQGMRAVRLVEELVRSDGYRLVRMMGLQTGLYYNDPAYYPVYAKCAELGVPVGLNVGFPGPRVPGKYQDPMPVDDVACFFPGLTIVLQHGGEPWVDTCVKLMVKWPNVHYMSSAIAPTPAARTGSCSPATIRCSRTSAVCARPGRCRSGTPTASPSLWRAMRTRSSSAPDAP
jgi:predicted TIM-barrel fold metal-dependent hydrolase